VVDNIMVYNFWKYVGSEGTGNTSTLSNQSGIHICN